MIKKLLAAFTAITLLAPFTPNNTMMKAFSEDESSILYDEEMKEYLASDDAHYSIEDFTYSMKSIEEMSVYADERYYSEDGSLKWIISRFINSRPYYVIDELEKEWDDEWTKKSDEYNKNGEYYEKYGDFYEQERYKFYLSKAEAEFIFGVYEGLEYVIIPETEFEARHVEIGHFTREAGKDIVIPDEIEGLPVTNVMSSGPEPITSIVLGDNITNLSSSFYMCPFLEKVVLPEKLENMNSCFEECPKLKTIEFSANLREMYSSFTKCPSIKEIELPESVEIISDCFKFTNLTSVTIPDSVKYIGNDSFSYCLNLEDVKLGSNVGEIGGGAFAYSKIKTVNIPASAEDLGYNRLGNNLSAFWECPFLTHVYIDKDNKNYYDIDGIPYERSTDTVLFYPRQRIDEFDLPAKTISDYSMYHADTYNGLRYIIVEGRYVQIIGTEKNYYMNDVVIPSKIAGFPVKTIGGTSFNTMSIESIEFPDTIKELAFICNECPALKRVKLPSGLEKISSSFKACPALTEIKLPDTLVSMDENTFSESGLISLDIPASVEDICGDANGFLFGCNSLEAVTVDDDNPNYYDSDGVPYVRGTNELILVPPKKSGKLVFPDDFDDFETVFLGTNKSITSLAVSASNKKYKSVDGCIYTKDGKELVLVPSGMTGEFEIPETVEKIGYAFQNADLEKLVIPSGVTELSNLSLTGNVDELVFKGDFIAMRFNKEVGTKRLATINRYIRSSDRNYNDMFTLNIGSGELLLPGNCAFDGKKIKGVKKLGFGSGSYVEILGMPGSPKLDELVFSPDIAELCIVEGADVSELVLPNGNNVIGERAFSSCKKLSSVIVNGTSEIRKGAFISCSALKKLELKKKAVIDESAFEDCTALEGISISTDSELSGNSFNMCDKLMKINGIDALAENGIDFATGLDEFIRKNFDQAEKVGFIDRWIANMTAHIVSEYTNENMPDAEKVKVLHDWIVNNTVYDLKDDDFPENHVDSSIFMDGIAVCEGYAKTYNLLLHEAGIETEYVETIGHAWNIVKVDRKYFHVDTTWDDLMSSYQWFMVSDKQILQPGGVHDNWKVKQPSQLHGFQGTKLFGCNTVVGDMNGDGSFSQDDIKELRSYVVQDGEYNISVDLDFNGKTDAADIGEGYKKLSIVMGDVNEDGEVGLADALSILQYTANSRKYPLSEKAVVSADVYDNGDGITPMDALAIQQKDARIITKLPCSYSLNGKRIAVE